MGEVDVDILLEQLASKLKKALVAALVALQRADVNVCRTSHVSQYLANGAFQGWMRPDLDEHEAALVRGHGGPQCSVEQDRTLHVPAPIRSPRHSSPLNLLPVTDE